MYHYVRPIKNSIYPEIKGLELVGFIRQVNYFRKNFNFIDLNEVLDSIYRQKEMPENSILLTFDDGFKDHFQNAFPILKKFGISGIFSLSGKSIKEKKVLEVHKIHFILACCQNKKSLAKEILSLIKKNKKQYHLYKADFYYKKLAISNRFDTADVIFIKRALQRELPMLLRNEIVNNLFKDYVTKNEEDFANDLYLSYDEIKEMKENGMFFASHGYSHLWLSHLDDMELKQELKKNSEFFYEINNDKKYWVICYPYGDYNEKVIEKVKNNDFKAGFTTQVSDSNLILEKAFTISRYDTNDFPQ